MEHQGFVDKFIGDAIMAVFDQPDKTDADEAENALDAALGMQKFGNAVKNERKSNWILFRWESEFIVAMSLSEP